MNIIMNRSETFKLKKKTKENKHFASLDSPTVWKVWGSSNKASRWFGAAARNLRPGSLRFHIKVPVLKVQVPVHKVPHKGSTVKSWDSTRFQFKVPLLKVDVPQGSTIKVPLLKVQVLEGSTQRFHQTCGGSLKEKKQVTLTASPLSTRAPNPPPNPPPPNPWKGGWGGG